MRSWQSRLQHSKIWFWLIVFATCLAIALIVLANTRGGAQANLLNALGGAVLGASAGAFFSSLSDLPALGVLRQCINDLANGKPLSGDTDLEPFRRKYHAYHITENSDREIFWVYKTLDFAQSLAVGKLSSMTTVVTDESMRPEDNEYICDAWLDGPHLVLNLRRKNGRSDVGYSIFQSPDGHKYPLCGAHVFISWADRLAVGPHIISTVPLIPISEEGRILDEDQAESLWDTWKR
jgi:hypothetical protein